MLRACDACGHIWPAFYLPMDGFVQMKIMIGAHCPMCGERALSSSRALGDKGQR